MFNGVGIHQLRDRDALHRGGKQEVKDRLATDSAKGLKGWSLP